jgi:biopolymer transport protein ExbD
MALNVGSSGEGDPDVMIDINTTPLIDVLLVLLVMLIITLPVQTHEVKLDMPIPGTPPPPVPPPVVDIVVDFDGTITWNGDIVNRLVLDAKLTDAASQSDQPEIHLHPNKLAPYKFVAAVMADAQRIGVERIGIVGNETMVQ